MTEAEVRVVKRKLCCYQDLLAMAKQKDLEAILLQNRYEQLAGVKGISLDPKVGSSGGYSDKTHLYTQIFSEQLEADKKAAEYRRQATAIKRFINAVDDERKEFLRQAYIEGKRFWQIGEEAGYSREGVQKAIDRCLEGVSVDMATASGLL